MHNRVRGRITVLLGLTPAPPPTESLAQRLMISRFCRLRVATVSDSVKKLETCWVGAGRVAQGCTAGWYRGVPAG